jgi:hypothetical protein
MIDLSFGLEYEVQLKNVSDVTTIVTKFNNFLNSGELLDFSYTTLETSFRVAPNKTEVIEKIMPIFSEHYHFNESTTHIHCDCLGFRVSTFDKILSNLSEDRKDDILEQLLKLTCYQLIGNKRAIAYDKKHNMVNLRPHFNTIEYRCFPVTFDSSLLLWQLENLNNIHMELLWMLKGNTFIDRIDVNMSSEDIKKRKIVYATN